MDVIYSYKKIQGYEKLMDEKFYQMARISVNSAKKFYNTILYTDSECKNLFEINNVPFNKIIVLDDIENYKNNFYSVVKLLAMKFHGSNFIHLDLDSIITRPIQIKTDIGFAYFEYKLDNNSEIYTNYVIMNSYYRLLKIFFPNKIEPTQFDFTEIPNASLIYSKGSKLKNIINKIFEEFSESIWLSDTEFVKKYNTSTGGYCSLIEQFFIIHFIKKQKIKFSVVYENQPTLFNELDITIDNRKYNYGITSIHKIYESPFIHFQNYNQDNNNFKYLLAYMDEHFKKKIKIL